MYKREFGFDHILVAFESAISAAIGTDLLIIQMLAARSA